MTFTPSAKGSFVAGIGFWVLLWLAVLKLDEIAGWSPTAPLAEH